MIDDKQRQSPTTSDHIRHSPTMSEGVRHRPTLSVGRREDHTLTSTEVVKLFEQENLPRSQRSIERYCTATKLDCFFDEDEQRYYVTQASAERLIGQLHEIQARHAYAAFVGQGGTAGDRARRDQRPLADDDTEGHDRTKLKEFEDKIFNLEIDKRAKEQVINQLKDQMRDDREEFISKLVVYTHRVGQLETEVSHLKQLQAPRHETIPPEAVEIPQRRDTEYADVTP